MIVFDNTIADILVNKKFYPTVTELFIRERKLNISLAFITQFYFADAKNVTLNSINYFIMKISNKRELQQIVFNHSWNIDFQEFINLYRKCLKTIFFFYDSYYSCIRSFFTYDKESFKKNIKTNHDNWW